MAWGICLPATCSSADARDILSTHLEPMRRALQVDGSGIIVGEVQCRTMDPRKVDLNPESLKPMTKGQVSITNWKWLAQSRPPGEPPRPFDAIHGIKACTMYMVTVGHRPFTSLGSPMFNAQFMEDFFTRPETAIILGGTVIVDTFFFMSGCLLLYGLLERRATAKSLINIPLLYLRRYLRLAPALMLVTAFYATLFPRLGMGPLWEQHIAQERDNCINNWWANLFMVQTFVHPEEMCLIQSWYVAVEFQAFLLCVPVAVLICRHRRVGLYALTFMTFLCLLIPFILTIVYNLDALLMPYIPVIQNLAKDPTFLNVYIPTYMRATPYFIGMFCALAIRWANKNRFKLPKWLVVMFHVCSFLLLLFVCYSSWIFFRPGAPKSALASATYAVLARIGWSLGISWQIFAPATGHGWWIGQVFAWRPMAPFGRLTYGAFLTHVGFQLHEVATMATPRNVTVMYLVRNNFADFIFSYFIAMVLFLCLESPLTSLERIFIGPSNSRGSSRRPGMAPNGTYSHGGGSQTPNAHPLMKFERNRVENSH
ncbi:nose resistant to fluoxetine protein 6-like [Hetaerina americana]|uniref:nose resistant to fluoxetine protein 6-like n=1 Tax=Hetaerina americana TaxID=62018 RepID=UPI003A7F1E11